MTTTESVCDVCFRFSLLAVNSTHHLANRAMQTQTAQSVYYNVQYMYTVKRNILHHCSAQRTGPKITDHYV